MTIREMKNTFEGWAFYESSFDTETGTLVRVCEESAGQHGEMLENHPKWGKSPDYPGPLPYALKGEEMDKAHEAWQEWRKEHPDLFARWRNAGYRRHLSFSPVPETIDVSITDACSHGCPYCYMGSTAKGEHAPVKLIETLFEGLDTAPYQIALGGGEPTLHPELPTILEIIRSHETVPSFTTAGYNLRQDVIDATNKFVGGVALTYHRHRGIDWFVKTFRTWKEALRPGLQFNIHVIADKDGARSLNDLADAFIRTDGLTLSDLNIVLLAYMPDLGRAKLNLIMPKAVYQKTFPEALTRLIKGDGGDKAKVAFSEGLLPFFFSHPELGIDLTYATALEGRFSCYVNPRGFLAKSSFEHIREEPDEYGHQDTTIYDTPLQELWRKAGFWWEPHGSTGGPCYDCTYSNHRCTSLHPTLQFMCAWQNVNEPAGGPPLTTEAQEQRKFWGEIHQKIQESRE